MQSPSSATPHPLVPPSLAQRNSAVDRATDRVTDRATDWPPGMPEGAGNAQIKGKKPPAAGLRPVSQKLPSFDDVFAQENGDAPKVDGPAKGDKMPPPTDANTVAQAAPSGVSSADGTKVSGRQMGPASTGVIPAADLAPLSPLPAHTADNFSAAKPAMRFDTDPRPQLAGAPALARDIQPTDNAPRTDPTTNAAPSSQQAPRTSNPPLPPLSASDKHLAPEQPLSRHAALSNTPVGPRKGDDSAVFKYSDAPLKHPLQEADATVVQRPLEPVSPQSGTRSAADLSLAVQTRQRGALPTGQDTNAPPPRDADTLEKTALLASLPKGGADTSAPRTTAQIAATPDRPQQRAVQASGSTADDPRWITTSAAGQNAPQPTHQTPINHLEPVATDQAKTAQRPPIDKAAPDPKHATLALPPLGARDIETADMKRAALASNTAAGAHTAPVTNTLSAVASVPAVTTPSGVVAGPETSGLAAPPVQSKGTPSKQLGTAPLTQAQAPVALSVARARQTVPVAHAAPAPVSSVQPMAAQTLTAGPFPAVSDTISVQSQPVAAPTPVVSKDAKADSRAERFASTATPSNTAAAGRTAPAPWMTNAANAPPTYWSVPTQHGPFDKPQADRSMAEPAFAPARTDSGSVQTTSPQSAPRTDLPPHTLRQIADVVTQMPGRPVEITLSPEELGRLRMTVRVTDGGVVVNLLAERPETLDLLRRNIDQLGGDFQALGFENIAFSFGSDDTPAQGDSHDQQRSSPVFAHATPDAETTQIVLNGGATAGLDLRL